MRVLEIGCAPGKLLAFVAAVLRADASGLDYSKRGMEYANQLFQALSIQGDLRCEDLFKTTFQEGAFDVVYSVGVIEHFDDPRDVVERHVRLCKPGGTALIWIPNYGALYGRIQRWCDPANLAIHNIDIMNPDALAELVPTAVADKVEVLYEGFVTGSLLSLQKRWPPPVASVVSLALNVIGLMQPFQLRALCPRLLLKITRSELTAGRVASKIASATLK
jgi:SAM-dependent methyltransferase